MTEEKIARINELAKLQKTVGLTTEQKEEQALLRREFIDSIKANLTSQLENIDIVNEDGSITPVKDLKKKK